VRDDRVRDLAVEHLGRRQEPRRSVDGRLRVVELEARRRVREAEVGLEERLDRPDVLPVVVEEVSHLVGCFVEGFQGKEGGNEFCRCGLRNRERKRIAENQVWWNMEAEKTPFQKKKKKTHHFALLGGLGDDLAAEVVAVGVLLREEVQKRVLLEDVDPILVLRRESERERKKRE